MNKTQQKTEPFTEIQAKSIKKKFIYAIAFFLAAIFDFYKDIFLNTHKTKAFYHVQRRLLAGYAQR